MRAYLAAFCLLAASPAAAQSLTVLSSNATKALIEELGPPFEKATGQKLTLASTIRPRSRAASRRVKHSMSRS